MRKRALLALAALLLAACPEGAPRSTKAAPDPRAAVPITGTPASWAVLFEVTIGGRPAPPGLVVALLDSPVFGTCDADSWLRAPKADTDADGHAGFRRVTPGHYFARLDTPLHGVRVVEVDVPATDVIRLDVPDEPLLAGRVLDETGAPLVGATVEAVHGSLLADDAAFGDFDPTRTTLTDRDGTFRFGGLHPGEWQVTAKRADRVTVAGRRAVAGTTDLELALPPAVRLFGRVVDDRGDGLAGVWVAARRPGEGEFHFERFRSDEGGEFEVFVPEGGAWELAARHDHLVSKVRRATPRAPVTLTLPPGITVRGRVVRPDGRPLTRFSVRGEPVHFLYAREVRDPEGRFELRYVRPEVKTLIFLGEGSDRYEVTLSARPGRVTTLDDIVLGGGLP